MSDAPTFTYHGVELPLFFHMYNLTHLNERQIEVAVAHWWLEGTHPGMGLEVGNVLGHYMPRSHNVIDLHEVPAWYQLMAGQQITNVDIFNVTPMPNSAWVISLSTIEHTADPIRAIEILRQFVKPGGKLLVSFPMGERVELDEMVLWTGPGTLFDRWCTIVRTDNSPGGWWQTEDVEWRAYGPWANSVFIGEWEAPA